MFDIIIDFIVLVFIGGLHFYITSHDGREIKKMNRRKKLLLIFLFTLIFTFIFIFGLRLVTIFLTIIATFWALGYLIYGIYVIARDSKKNIPQKREG